MVQAFGKELRAEHGIDAGPIALARFLDLLVKTRLLRAGRHGRERVWRVPPSAAARREKNEHHLQKAPEKAGFGKLVTAKPSLVHGAALRALDESGGRGRAMLTAFGKQVRKEHGVEVSTVTLERFLALLVETGLLRIERDAGQRLWIDASPLRVRKHESAARPAPPPGVCAHGTGHPARAWRHAEGL